MEPLSCSNCCHNPMQIGPLGTTFGFCTRHRLLLNAPNQTTCGQLYRKDLPAKRAEEERQFHQNSFSEEFVSLVADPQVHAKRRKLAELPNGALPSDAVFEDVRSFGRLDSKISSLAALRRDPGVRGEIAFLSLGRGYVRTCLARGGSWTSGVHLLWWTLGRLREKPIIAATDLREPAALSIAKLVSLAQWHVVAFRLILIDDIAQAGKDDPVHRLSRVVRDAIASSAPGIADSLLGQLSRQKGAFETALSPQRYEKLATGLHRDDP